MTDTQRLKDKLTDLRLKGMLQQLDVAILSRTHGDKELTQQTRCVR